MQIGLIDGLQCTTLQQHEIRENAEEKSAASGVRLPKILSHMQFFFLFSLVCKHVGDEKKFCLLITVLRKTYANSIW